MIGTYEEYLKEPKSLTVEEMQALHRAMLEELGDDEDAWDLYRDLVQAAVDYAAVRAQWQLYSYAERAEKDPGRTAKVRELNVAAVDVVKRLGNIATDDLFALLDPLDREQNWSDTYHHKPPVRQKEAEQVAASVMAGGAFSGGHSRK